MPAGGRRPGAGRKTKQPDGSTDLFVKALAKNVNAHGADLGELSIAVQNGGNCLVRAILARQNELVDAMITLSLGVTVQEVDEEGHATVYTKPPDRQALQWLLEKAHGKPTVKTETKHETQISIHHEVPRPDPDDIARAEQFALESRDRKAKIEEDHIDVRYEVDLSQAEKIAEF